MVDLSPIKGSPPASPLTHLGKENKGSLHAITNTAMSPNGGVRRPFGAVSPRFNHNVPVQRLAPKTPIEEAKEKRRSRILGDVTSHASNNKNAENVNPRTRTSGNGARRSTGQVKQKDHVRERVKEWEREKERLREMERLEELERERDEQIAEEEKKDERLMNALAAREREREREESAQQAKESPVEAADESEAVAKRSPIVASSPVLPKPAAVTPLTPGRPLPLFSRSSVFTSK